MQPCKATSNVIKELERLVRYLDQLYSTGPCCWQIVHQNDGKIISNDIAFIHVKFRRHLLPFSRISKTRETCYILINSTSVQNETLSSRHKGKQQKILSNTKQAMTCMTWQQVRLTQFRPYGLVYAANKWVTHEKIPSTSIAFLRNVHLEQMTFTTFGLIMTLTSDLLTSKSDEFIFS